MAKKEDRGALAKRLSDSAMSPREVLKFEGSSPFGGETLHRYRLGNGLTVLLLVDKQAPVVSYFTWFRVGSRHEKVGKTGLAHFFEHLMFNETEKLSAGEFDRKLEENGAESNAGTWVDWTYYYESLPADRVGLAIELESERMHRLVLREPQVASEKEVVANERRYRVDDDVEGTAGELLYKTAFTKHPYHWPTIGWMSDIEAYAPADCEAFYRTFYAPNNATVVLVGDMKEDAVLAKIQKAYGIIDSSVIPPEDADPEPPQTEERALTIHKPTASEKLLVGYKGPSLGDVDHVALTVLNEILFGGRAARLYRSMVVEKEIASDIRGSVSPLEQPGLYEVFVTTREGHSLPEIESVLDVEFEKVRREVVSPDELSRAKARLELSLLQSLETTSGKAEQIGFYETVLGDPTAAFRRLEAYRRCSESDLRRVARRYLVNSARTVIRILPDTTKGDAPEGTEEAAQ